MLEIGGGLAAALLAYGQSKRDYIALLMIEQSFPLPAICGSAATLAPDQNGLQGYVWHLGFL